MEKTYNPQDIEQPLYEHWEKQGYFKPNGDESKESFCIMIPPPNVTGSLHMGHAFQQTIMDTMIRYQRMQGKNTLWQAGTDHAGIATQMVVERKIAAEEGKTRHDYGREAFIDKIWQWKAESGGTITRQMRRLGNSVDWERERFTMDEGLSNAVKEVFVRLYKEDLIYRGKRLVNWDPKLRTAISDLEVENRESKGSMWHIRYPLADGAKTADGKDYLVVATTRPETILGDTGVAVNPEDPRYKDLIGKFVILPLVNRRIPIVGDEHADMEKGTGCVKITPAHDFNDYEVGKRHGLPMINILTFDGDIRETAEVYDTKGEESDVYSNEIPAEFQKLERFAARKAIVAAIDAMGLLEEIKPHDLTVPYGDRGGVVIEPMLTDQWYVRADVLAKPAVEAVETATSSSYRSSTKTCTSPGCAIFRTGVFPVSCGGVTVSRHGMTTTATYMLAVPKTKCVRKTTSAPTFSFVRTKTFWIPGSPPRCGPSPRSAGRKTPTRCVSSTQPA